MACGRARHLSGVRSNDLKERKIMLTTHERKDQKPAADSNVRDEDEMVG